MNTNVEISNKNTDAAIVAALAVEAANANKLDTPTPAVILRGDQKIQSTEHLLGNRARFRGVMATTSLADFVAYTKERPGGRGFIHPEEPKAMLFFNIGTVDNPGHCDDRAVLELKETAALRALRAIDGRQQTQKAAAEWLEDWAAELELSATDSDGSPVPLAGAIRAIGSITVKTIQEATSEVRDFGAKRSALEEIEARATGYNSLPAKIHFSVQPCPGLPKRGGTLRVSLLTGGDKPQLVLRFIGREQFDEGVIRDFKAALVDEIGDAASLVIGVFNP
jgi:uncharacterized protein YfdQ (DUF2303 family)